MNDLFYFPGYKLLSGIENVNFKGYTMVHRYIEQNENLENVNFKRYTVIQR